MVNWAISAIVGGDVPLCVHFGRQFVIMSLKSPASKYLYVQGFFFFFDLWPDSNIPLSSRNLISILFLVAKCVVAKKWNQIRLPSVKVWHVKIWDLIVADKLSENILFYERCRQKNCFLDKWYSFLDNLYSAKHVRTWKPRKYRFISLY